LGRILAASGSVEPWKSVGSDTGHGTRETGHVVRQKSLYGAKRIRNSLTY